MFALEKMQKNQPLTPGDIQDLLKDPNSWLSKLLTECSIYIEINEFDFLNLIAILVEEERRVLSQEKLDAMVLTQFIAEKQANDLPLPKSTIVQPATQQQPRNPEQEFKLTKLKTEMNTLLNASQKNMSLTQLETHNERLLVNFNNQVDVMIGPEISLDNGRKIAVPISAPRTQLPYSRYLEVTGLQELILSGQANADDVSKFKTHQDLGTIEIIHRAGKINRKQSAPLSTKDFIGCAKTIDEIFSEARKNNPGIFDALIKNKKLVIEKLVENYKATHGEDNTPRPGPPGVK